MIRTKLALTDALFSLLEKKSMETITVSGLCKQAKVSRRTFYIHYANINEIFEDYRNALSVQVYQALSNRNLSAEGLLVVFDKILMANFQGFKYLCLNQNHHSLIQDLNQMLYTTLCDVLSIPAYNSRARMITEYLSVGIINSYVFWFQHPDMMNYQELVNVNREIVDTNLKLIRTTIG